MWLTRLLEKESAARGRTTLSSFPSLLRSVLNTSSCLLSARAAKVRRALPFAIRACVCVCVKAGGTGMCARANTGLGVCVYATVAVVTTTLTATVGHCVRADYVDSRLSTNSDNRKLNCLKRLPHRHGRKLVKF